MAQFRKDTHQYLGDGKTIFEVVMLADQYGNLVGPANPSGAAVDAFGRARVSEPYTIFDSFNRYADNGKFNYANTAGGTYGFTSNTSSIDYTITTTSGAYVYAETKKVFAYQLERNSFTNTATTWTLAVTSGTNTSNVAGQILWEELT